jgi:hypothetical protein
MLGQFFFAAKGSVYQERAGMSAFGGEADVTRKRPYVSFDPNLCAGVFLERTDNFSGYTRHEAVWRNILRDNRSGRDH